MNQKKRNIILVIGLFTMLFLLEYVILDTIFKHKSAIGISLIFVILLSIIIILGIATIILEKLFPKNKVSEVPERIIHWINENIQPI